jgi:hypothetical protein
MRVQPKQNRLAVGDAGSEPRYGGELATTGGRPTGECCDQVPAS